MKVKNFPVLKNIRCRVKKLSRFDDLEFPKAETFTNDANVSALKVLCLFVFSKKFDIDENKVVCRTSIYFF